MDKIGKKRLKRKNKINNRLKCHGNKLNCEKHRRKPAVYGPPIRPRVLTPVVRKKKWWEKLLEFLRLK